MAERLKLLKKWADARPLWSMASDPKRKKKETGHVKRIKIDFLGGGQDTRAKRNFSLSSASVQLCRKPFSAKEGLGPAQSDLVCSEKKKEFSFISALRSSVSKRRKSVGI